MENIQRQSTHQKNVAKCDLPQRRWLEGEYPTQDDDSHDQPIEYRSNLNHEKVLPARF